MKNSRFIHILILILIAIYVLAILSPTDRPTASPATDAGTLGRAIIHEIRLEAAAINFKPHRRREREERTTGTTMLLRAQGGGGG